MTGLHLCEEEGLHTQGPRDQGQLQCNDEHVIAVASLAAPCRCGLPLAKRRPVPGESPGTHWSPGVVFEPPLGPGDP